MNESGEDRPEFLARFGAARWLGRLTAQLIGVPYAESLSEKYLG